MGSNGMGLTPHKRSETNRCARAWARLLFPQSGALKGFPRKLNPSSLRREHRGLAFVVASMVRQYPGFFDHLRFARSDGINRHRLRDSLRF